MAKAGHFFFVCFCPCFVLIFFVFLISTYFSFPSLLRLFRLCAFFTFLIERVVTFCFSFRSRLSCDHRGSPGGRKCCKQSIASIKSTNVVHAGCVIHMSHDTIATPILHGIHSLGLRIFICQNGLWFVCLLRCIDSHLCSYQFDPLTASQGGLYGSYDNFSNTNNADSTIYLPWFVERVNTNI